MYKYEIVIKGSFINPQGFNVHIIDATNYKTKECVRFY